MLENSPTTEVTPDLNDGENRSDPTHGTADVKTPALDGGDNLSQTDSCASQSRPTATVLKKQANCDTQV